MNQLITSLGAWGMVWIMGAAALLCLAFGIRIGRAGARSGHPLGLPEGSVRGLLALMIVGATEAMLFSGRDIPTEQWAAFAAIVWLYFRMRAEQKVTAEAQRAQRDEPAVDLADPLLMKRRAEGLAQGGASGFVSFRLLLVTAAASLVVLLLPTGCFTTMQGAMGGAVRVAQSATDGLAQSVGISSGTVSAAREKVAEVEAEKVGRILLPPGSVLLADELREHTTHRLLTNGVYRRRIFEDVEVIAAAVPGRVDVPAPVPVSQTNSNEVPPSQSQTPLEDVTLSHDSNPTATTLPPSGGGATISGLNVTEQRIFRADARVKKAEGALSAVVSAATVSAEITIAGAEGWPERGGPVELTGRVTSISNGPPVDLGPLSFSGFASSVESGRLKVSSAAGADVQFSASADLLSGAFSGLAVPRDGTAAEAFFQSLELEGQAFLLGAVLRTNVVAVPVPTSAPPAFADAIEIAGAELLGTHARVNPAKAKITRKMTAASVEKGGGNVRMSFEPLRWPTEEASNGKTLDGRVYIFWYVGEKLTGGHFDWHGQGQTTKTLGNVWDGYLKGQKPPGGAKVWFCITSLDCDERTTVCESSTRWP